MTTASRTGTALYYRDGRAFGSPHASPLLIIETPVGRVERVPYDDALLALMSIAIDGRALSPAQQRRLGRAAACLLADLDAERNVHQVTALLVPIPDEDPDAFEIDPDPTDSVDVHIVDMPPDSPPEEIRHG